MSLSDKVVKQAEFRRRHCDDVVLVGGFVWNHHIKEFINKLKDIIMSGKFIGIRDIDKLSGSEFINKANNGGEK